MEWKYNAVDDQSRTNRTVSYTLLEDAIPVQKSFPEFAEHIDNKAQEPAQEILGIKLTDW